MTTDPHCRRSVNARINCQSGAFDSRRAFFQAAGAGLMTVEAAIALPIFLILVTGLLQTGLFLGASAQMYGIMASGAHELSVWGHDRDFSTAVVMAKAVTDLYRYPVDTTSFDGGSSAVNWIGSGYDPDSREICLSARYTMKSLIPLPVLNRVRIRTTLYTRAFAGGKMLSESTEAASGEEGRIVYVAQNGIVYHTTMECAYLDLDLRAVSLAGVSDLRSEDGGKYYPCERCAASGVLSPVVYITGYGNRYHTTDQCGSLKRTVYTMRLTSDCLLPACTKCGP